MIKVMVENEIEIGKQYTAKCKVMKEGKLPDLWMEHVFLTSAVLQDIINDLFEFEKLSAEQKEKGINLFMEQVKGEFLKIDFERKNHKEATVYSLESDL